MASILNTAAEAGCFKTLLAAVAAAGLSEALDGPGPFTVFAPVDDAFAALPAGTVQTLVDTTFWPVHTPKPSWLAKATGRVWRGRRSQSAAASPLR